MAEDTTDRLDAAVALVAASGPDIGSVWRHLKKGSVYRVVCCAIREADLVPVVVYCTYYPRGEQFDKMPVVTWVRPLTEFTDGRFAMMARAPKE